MKDKCSFSDEIVEMVQEENRKEHNLYERERYHCIGFDYVCSDLATILPEKSKKKRKRSLDTNLYQDSVEAQLEEKENLAAKYRLIQRIEKALHSLSTKQRRRFKAHVYGGLTHSEIARKEGVSQQSVSESIATAKKNIVNKL